MIVTGVDALTAFVVTWNAALVAPAATVTLGGTIAAPGLLVFSVTSAPPAGAAPFNVAVPWAAFPPSTVDGLIATEDNAGAEAAARGVRRRATENGPATPAALRARTRHHKRVAGRFDKVACDTFTVALARKGVEKVELSSTCSS